MCGWQLKLCDLLTQAISERFRDEVHDKVLYKSTLLYFTLECFKLITTNRTQQMRANFNIGQTYK